MLCLSAGRLFERRFQSRPFCCPKWSTDGTALVVVLALSLLRNLILTLRDTLQPCMCGGW